MGEASDDDVVAREHVHDIVSGRLPAEDVASNIAEDLRRIRSQLAAVTKERDEARADLEQREVQLAGCGVAALGGTKDPAMKGQYGWSASYGDVLALRLKYETAVEALESIVRPGSTGVLIIARQALAAIRAGEEKK